MKKGLSALLIAAALFGFYGGAVNLNDVLACKDYWEAEDERTTADLNKLEDGLNQLKENEQAYLDGLDTLAEGEQALADGEAQYAAGQEELAKGEADYAAAPGKLRAGEKKLAAGKAALAKGESDLSKLNDLIDGIEQILAGYPEWKSGYEQLREGRVGSIKEPNDTSQLVSVLKAYYTNASDPAAGKALQDLEKAGALFAAQDENKFTNEQYDGFKDYLNATITALDDANTFFENTKANHNTIAGQFASVLNSASTAAEKYSAVATLAREAELAGKKAQQSGAQEDIDAATEAYNNWKAAETNYGELDDLRVALNDELDKCKQLAQDPKVNGAVQLAANVFIAAKDSNSAQQVIGALNAVAGGLTIAQNGSGAENIKSYLTAVGTIPVALGNVNDGISEIQNSTLAAGKAKAKMWLDGYATITSSDTQNSQKTLVGGVDQIIGGVLGSKNDELISGMNKAAAAVGFNPKSFTPFATSKLAQDMASGSKLENFYNDMNKIEKGFKAVLPQLKNKASDGAKTLAAGKKQVAAGQKELNKGYADYKAAPGKLAAGRAKLADAEQQLADGRKQLADGKEKLAEYEDGEQQVRDGLATLMASEANGGLQSILDRRSGDEDFDNGDEHLELDEGLDAVTVGREYKADSGELVTAEIMKRAIGTGLGLAAGALAVLAGLLSLLKKNKGAGVCAALTAIAGGAGIATGTSAGLEFSSIAGSAVGATPWIAFGVLAAVAAVHAIAHFAAKPEA